MYNYLNLSKFLLIIFLLSTLISCGESSSNKNYAEYEHLEFWKLRHDNATILIDDSISYEGDYSVKIISDHSNDLILANNFSVESYQDYEITVTVLRPENDIEKKAGVTVGFFEDYIYPYEDLVAIVKQADNTILSENAILDANGIWETKIFSFSTESNEPIKIYFMLGYHLNTFWLDSFSLNCTKCND